MNDTRPTLVLVYPANQLRKGFLVNRDTKYQPLSLGIIAALTPSHWKVKIIDENFRTFRYYPADLVGITAFSSTATRAYQIAQLYREKGVPVVMGGIHVSMMPDEALQFADSVVVGEAESVWPGLIRDFENNQLQKVYKGQLLPMNNSPLPRRDLFHPGYVFGSIQTSRGCPFDCSFCSVSAFNGRHYRMRPVDEVIEELKTIPQRNVFFLDDNIVGISKAHQERAIELFRKMVEAGIRKDWISQASLNLAENPEVLKWAARSGCKMIFVGVETEQPEGLEESNKKINLRIGVNAYEEVFKKVHRYGISVIAGFMFGWDTDTPERIHQRVKYIRKSNADSIQSTFVTPLPGTRLYDKLRQEGRFIHDNFPDDWQRFDYGDMVFRPALMTREEFLEEMNIALNRIYDPSHLRRKFFKSWWNLKSFTTAYWSYMSNWNYRNMFIQDGKKVKNWFLDK
ncbi:MAG: hypothetical protein PWP35_2295 [Bacteroidales bacterium]|nr:hypothetical protein [Bacteroidales bacterium]NLH53235.1 B12-binding domain-containing radical SAM protein [Bacteroidales bacterium]NPV37026.1 B12-binding domain-containing radical SAM protein [Bacteroidales bacterium]